MGCQNARDTITQSLGYAIANHVDYPDSEHIVTSFCRAGGGTWIAWYDLILGDGIDAYLTDAYGDDEDKRDWPSLIASATAVSVGYFPDDGSPSTVYDLGIEPVFSWNTVGAKTPSDPCAHYPFIGDIYADVGKAQLTGWGMAPIDVQVRTDGSSVWVIVLARESVKYPYLYNSPSEIDDCDATHPTFEDYWSAGHSDAFFHDDDAGNRWWIYQLGNLIHSKPFGDYDDPGWDSSFRWQPARVTVFAGDLGGFTRLDTVEAKFDNAHGLCSGIECAASPAEPGVLHVLWAEGGNFGPQTHARMRGQRITYSRWTAGGKDLDVDLLYSEEAGSGQMSDSAWVFTAEMILRNDHGSPAAIVWPWVTAGGPQYVSPLAQYWDLSSGELDVVQVADATLAPTEDETGFAGTDVEVFGSLVNSGLQVGSLGFVTIRRSQFASAIYSDPTLDGQDVYLICVRHGDADLQPAALSFLRIPCDGSAGFDYMDGNRSVGYSIVPYTPLPGGATLAANFHADFVSEPDNVWMPSSYIAGGDVLHLDRQCLKVWEELRSFPEDSDTGYAAGDWNASINNVSPPAIVTDEAGDWLTGGGQIPASSSPFPVKVAALRAKICRCCVPCQGTGFHTWIRV